MNKLTTARRAEILGCLTEGLSIRATCRLTGAAKVTVLRLMADAARVCIEHHDRVAMNLSTTLLQCDEAWGFVGCKDKAKKAGAQGYGSAWVWVAQDAQTKLVVSWIVGQRDGEMAEVLMLDVASRIPGKVQISTDALQSYPSAVSVAFPPDENGQVRFTLGTVVKTYATPKPEDQRRYSPSVCVGCTREATIGEPDAAHISTSYIERQNRDLRMRCRRMTRLTDAFSKRVENHASAVCRRPAAPRESEPLPSLPRASRRGTPRSPRTSTGGCSATTCGCRSPAACTAPRWSPCRTPREGPPYATATRC